VAAPPPVAAVAAPVAISGLTENDVRDMIAKRFPSQFSRYYYTADEEDLAGYDTDEMDEHNDSVADRAKERALPIPKMLDIVSKTLQNVFRDNETLKSNKTPQNNPEVLGLNLQIKQMDEELITKNEKITNLQTRLESYECEANKTNRLLNQVRNQNTKMMELLKSNGIEYNPYD
jgi:hypothetical protein